MAEAALKEKPEAEAGSESPRFVEPMAPAEVEIDLSGAPAPKLDKRPTDKPQADVEVVPAEALAAREKLDRTDDPVAEMRRQLASERAKSDQLVREANDRAAQAERNAGVSTVNAIDMAIDAQTRAMATAKERMTAALDAGNHKDFAEAQELFNTAQFDVMKLRDQKAYAETQNRQPAPRQQQPASQLDRIVASLEAANSPRSAAWLKSHPEQANNPNRLDAAHRQAVFLENIAPDSEEYLARMEQILGIAAKPEASPAASQQAPQRSSPRAAAPVSRETPNLSTGQPQTVRIALSSEQREMAAYLGMTDQEYALEMHRAKESGKLNGGR